MKYLLLLFLLSACASAPKMRPQVVANADQPGAVAVRQRMQERAVDDAEHRGIGADPEPERENRGEGVTG